MTGDEARELAELVCEVEKLCGHKPSCREIQSHSDSDFVIRSMRRSYGSYLMSITQRDGIQASYVTECHQALVDHTGEVITTRDAHGVYHVYATIEPEATASGTNYRRVIVEARRNVLRMEI